METSRGTATKKSGTFAFTITNGRHALLTDVEGKLGGEDRGMNPHQLLESALAACTAITLQMYAKRKGWPLEGADVNVTIAEEGKTSRLLRSIALLGELDAMQRQSLLEIANKCPIHKLLTGSITIETTLR